MHRFRKNLLLLLLAPMLWAYTYQAMLYILPNLKHLWGNWFLYGFFGYLLFYLVFLRSEVTFLEIFEHELSHTLTGAVFFNRVHLFAVHAKVGGVVEHQRASNFVIVLAPYFLPLFTLPLLPLRPFVNSPALNAIDLLIGITLAFHYAGLVKEFSSQQPDIQRGGVVFSFVVVVFFNALFAVLILSFVLGDYHRVVEVTKSGFWATLAAYRLLWSKLQLLYEMVTSNVSSA
jgi:hypothetical protein